MSDAKQTGDLLQLVTFHLGKEEYGVEIRRIREIIRARETTHTPKAPDYVEGLINIRGRIIPIIDLRRRFGKPVKAHDNQTRFVVMEICNSVVGFVVDAVHEVLRLRTTEVEPAPAVATAAEAECLSGVGKVEDRLVIILDMDHFFTQEEIARIGLVCKV